MEVTFTLGFLRQHPINWPRAEHEQLIMAMGHARSLDQALQHATPELIRWLRTDYRITERQIHLLLGQCIRYDIGNIFDSAYTMVAKVKKELLPNIT